MWNILASCGTRQRHIMHAMCVPSARPIRQCFHPSLWWWYAACRLTRDTGVCRLRLQYSTTYEYSMMVMRWTWEM